MWATCITYTQAIGQLGAELKDGRPNLEMRLGGIFALERIAKDSPRDYGTIMEVLTAYVRENAPNSPADDAKATEVLKPRADVEAVLTVLGRREPPEQFPEPRLPGSRASGRTAQQKWNASS